ncbi:phospholipase B-like protein [Kipferlia bialata]|uniref:Phospholipase B-like n=1 Tax=Kipferlia bialata TaxID=797122 RepID=A0A9K3GPB0_9EUKA|nr:phospholipase B-like protein [Kipferlia bialata]|eukprot:g12263.t1
MRVLLVALALLALALCEEQLASVTLEADGTYRIHSGIVAPNSIAWAVLSDETDENGWNFLSLHSDASVDGTDNGFYAAGILEGYMMAEGITFQIQAAKEADYSPWNLHYPTAAVSYVESQMEWMKNESDSQRHYSLYWDLVGNYLSFVEGLQAGYSLSPMSYVDEFTGIVYEGTPFDVLMLQVGDLTIYSI